MSPNAKRETTVVEEKPNGIRRDAKRSDGFLEATTEGLAFHDVLGDVQNLVGSGHDSDNDSAPQAA